MGLYQEKEEKKTIFGKHIVFAMTIKLIPEFWRNQEIPEKFWKTYEQVKLDIFQIFLFIPDFILYTSLQIT